VLRLLVLAIAAIFRPKALLIAENLCLRQQLVVLQRRHPRPRLSGADRRFWILASRWFSDWRHPLLIVKPETVLGWQRAGWRAYRRWRSSHKERGGRPAISVELQALIVRMAAENHLWGQKRIQAELARLGFQVSARTVAKYVRGCRRRGPTRTWGEFLTRHASNMWACDFFCVPTVLFQTRHVFFVIRLANREIFHVAVTRLPTADWAAQQIVECCAWDRAPPRFLIHDRDSRYGANFDRRVRGLGIRQVRTPFRSPQANAVAERWVRSVRSECLDHLIVFNEANFASSSIRVRHLLQSLAPAPLVGSGSSMRRGKAPPSASMPKDRRGTCTRRVAPHLLRCCMTSFSATQACHESLLDRTLCAEGAQSNAGDDCAASYGAASLARRLSLR
jgi:transposase InsO family protein